MNYSLLALLFVLPLMLSFETTASLVRPFQNLQSQKQTKEKIADLNGTVFIDSKMIYDEKVQGIDFYPNLFKIPPGSRIVRIEMGIAGQLDTLIVYLKSVSGIYSIGGFGSKTPINYAYEISENDRLKCIILAYYDNYAGTQFVGIQYLTDRGQSPFYMGSFGSRVQHTDLICFDENPISFYGVVHPSYMTIIGIGMVMMRETF